MSALSSLKRGNARMSGREPRGRSRVGQPLTHGHRLPKDDRRLKITVFSGGDGLTAHHSEDLKQCTGSGPSSSLSSTGPSPGPARPRGCLRLLNQRGRLFCAFHRVLAGCGQTLYVHLFCSLLFFPRDTLFY